MKREAEIHPLVGIALTKYGDKERAEVNRVVYTKSGEIRHYSVQYLQNTFA